MRERRPIRRMMACLAGAMVCFACESAPAYDLVIMNGTVVDGTGAPGYPAHVAVLGDSIAAISREPIDTSETVRVIDATGHVVAPGFIDLHAHLDPLLRLPDAESHVRQGVTTALGGPDGSSPWPLSAWLDSAAVSGLGMNVASLVGHNTIREIVLGMANRAPRPAELEAMQAMVAQGMQEGAFGLSTGLRYLPGAFAQLDEIVALSEVAARHGGIYTSHLRDEGMQLVAGVSEALEIGRRAGIPVVLTHHKVIGRPMWGASARTLAMIDSARTAGTDAMADQYPYTASYTGITVLVPAWAMAGGESDFLRRLGDSVLHDSILDGIIWNIENDRGGGDISRVQLALVEWDRSLEGRTLADWAEREGMPATPRSGALLVIEAIKRGGASAIYHVMDEADVERIMRHPFVAVASDGRLVRPGEGHPHPRWYGTFPRVLGYYVREREILSLEEAVRKMTSLPADRLGLADRGRLDVGARADIAVFDPATVADVATFEAPHQYPIGIPWVVVNGQIAVDRGAMTEVRAGRVLRHVARDVVSPGGTTGSQ